MRRRSSLAPKAPKGRPSVNYAIKKCRGKPVSERVLRFVEAEVEDYWRSHARREYPPKSSWEHDPLTTPEAKQRRARVLQNLQWGDISELKEKYAMFRRVTRDLMEVA